MDPVPGRPREVSASSLMHAFVPSLVEARQRCQHACAEIVRAYEARRLPRREQAGITPIELGAALEQFLIIAQRLDQEEGAHGPILKDDASQLGDYGLQLLTDMMAWANRLELEAARGELEAVTLAAGDWILRHEGEIRTLEPLVNALAALANRTRDTAALEALARFMGQVIRQTSNLVKQDLEKNNPGRPWRLLHWNRGIVATRSHNPALMEEAFEDLIRDLPEEAPGFFAEGMQQMEALKYPPPVRAIMRRYFDRWTRPRLH